MQFLLTLLAGWINRWQFDAIEYLALIKAAEEFCDTQGPTAERLEFVRAFDQAIAARHHLRLRYPPALLVRALREGIKGCSPDAAAQRALAEGSVPTDAEAEALRVYANILSGVPPILAGVQGGLQMAHEHCIPVYVISEGPLESLRARLQALELRQDRGFDY